MIKISIITGIYNPPEDLFRKYLDSCLNQTLEGVEFILILDDPNDTASRTILDQYKKNIKINKNKFIIIENIKNLGTYKTYKKGLLKASGKYVMFFDDDDFFDNDYLDLMWKYSNDMPVFKGRAITNYYKKLDFYMEYLIGDNSSNEDNWLFMFKKEFLLKYIKYYTFIYDTNIISSFSITDCEKIKEINKILNNIKTLPLEEGSFYHYVRHQSNTSDFSLQKKHYKNNDKNNCHENIRQKLIEKINNQKIHNLNKHKKIEFIRSQTFLDKEENINFNYEKIKSL